MTTNNDSSETPQHATRRYSASDGGPVTEPIPRDELPDRKLAHGSDAPTERIAVDEAARQREQQELAHEEERYEREREQSRAAEEEKASAESAESQWRHRLSLAAEFFRMSRSSAILLISFLLFALLYMWVRDEPVIGRNEPMMPPAPSTTVPTAPATPTGQATPTGTIDQDATGVTQPTGADDGEDYNNGVGGTTAARPGDVVPTQGGGHNEGAPPAGGRPGGDSFGQGGAGQGAPGAQGAADHNAVQGGHNAAQGGHNAAQGGAQAAGNGTGA